MGAALDWSICSCSVRVARCSVSRRYSLALIGARITKAMIKYMKNSSGVMHVSYDKFKMSGLAEPADNH